MSELAAVDGAHRFEIVIDAAALREADPIFFYRWDETAVVGEDPAAELRWLVDVRPDGYVVRWEGRSNTIETWTDYPIGLTFESPLVPVAPTAGDLVAPAPEDVVPPATVEG